MKVSDVIYEVKVRMQELTPFGEGLAVLDPSDGDSIPVTDGLIVLRPERYEKPVETYIRECLEESYKILMDIAPDRFLPIKTYFGAIAEKKQDGSGVIVLPGDFYKLKVFKMLGWERPVTSTIEINTVEYYNQFNRHKRGGISRPVAAVVNRDGDIFLEYYSLPEFIKNHEVELFSYVPTANLEKDSNGRIPDDVDISLDENIIEAYFYIVASRVYMIYELADMSKNMISQAADILNGIKLR